MTKEELSILKKINKEIEQIRKELNSVHPTMMPVSDTVLGSLPYFPYTEHPIGIAGFDNTQYERTIKRIQNRLNQKLQELMDEKDRITEYIYGVDDSDLRQILMYTYINGISQEQIAENMGISRATVQRKFKEWMLSAK
ncbi:sigma factor-like helix-turn-helix DNA-binding protein [Ruminiclostridium cellobioparum]|uniref:sigma factor-like helix-turn-helix DNA-binding protein n=1 Tax=Ruminiclostridium cellobioparum TaxID=29355 RepID=UPI0005502553|nr:sigma factor-like helix-turn-helix DNA-binding protein [Ruminiclostridium cellobioparum]